MAPRVAVELFATVYISNTFNPSLIVDGYFPVIIIGNLAACRKKVLPCHMFRCSYCNIVVDTICLSVGVHYNQFFYNMSFSVYSAISDFN